MLLYGIVTTKSTNTMITFKQIETYQAIREIFKHKKNWYLLHECIDNSKEVVEYGNEIFFDTDYDELYYINEKDYLWIAGYDENKLCFLQFIHKPVRNRLELVVAQKKTTVKSSNWFNGVVEYVKTMYPNLRSITTLPMNDKLKEYYKSFGFADYKHGELKLKIK